MVTLLGSNVIDAGGRLKLHYHVHSLCYWTAGQRLPSGQQVTAASFFWLCSHHDLSYRCCDWACTLGDPVTTHEADHEYACLWGTRDKIKTDKSSNAFDRCFWFTINGWIRPGCVQLTAALITKRKDLWRCLKHETWAETELFAEGKHAELNSVSTQWLLLLVDQHPSAVTEACGGWASYFNSTVPSFLHCDHLNKQSARLLIQLKSCGTCGPISWLIFLGVQHLPHMPLNSPHVQIPTGNSTPDQIRAYWLISFYWQPNFIPTSFCHSPSCPIQGTMRRPWFKVTYLSRREGTQRGVWFMLDEGSHRNEGSGASVAVHLCTFARFSSCKERCAALSIAWCWSGGFNCGSVSAWRRRLPVSSEHDEDEPICLDRIWIL